MGLGPHISNKSDAKKIGFSILGSWDWLKLATCSPLIGLSLEKENMGWSEILGFPGFAEFLLSPKGLGGGGLMDEELLRGWDSDKRSFPSKLRTFHPSGNESL